MINWVIMQQTPQLKETLIRIIKGVIARDERVIFAYLYGSFVRGESFRDIDLALYVKKETSDNPFIIISDIKSELFFQARKEHLNIPADQFDVQIMNEAPFTFLRRIFQEGILILDRGPDLRTDVVEYVSFQYRECAGLLAEASL